MKHLSGAVAILVTSGIFLYSSSSLSGAGLGPYEDRIVDGKTSYVGLLASAKAGKEAEFDKALQCLTCKECAKALKKQGITNISANRKVLTDKKTWYWVYFDYKGKDYLKAVNTFEKVTPAMAAFIDPHPRARTYGTSWLQMEWINYIRGVMDDDIPTKRKTCVVTRIIPKNEELYRTLHQTVWPGVIDQLARTNNRNLSIFLSEIGDEIYEFLYLEYVGNDPVADDKSSKADPCTLRWWKLTDACQDPLPEVKDGIWAGMDSVIKQ